MWIGSLRNSKQKLFVITWPSNPIKALGIYFSYNKKESHEFNFTQKLVTLKEQYPYAVKGKGYCFRIRQNNFFIQFLLNKIPIVQNIWQRLFGKIKWKEVYFCPRHVTMETKLQEFQFKIMHYYLATV